MAKYVYPAIFEPENDLYNVSFPDLPDCYTCGDTLADALFMAEDALSGYLARCKEKNRSFPAASALNCVASVQGSVVSLVLADMEAFRRRTSENTVRETTSTVKHTGGMPMYKAYPAIFHAEDGGFWVEFPDPPGCVTEGNNIAEAIAEASSALGGFLGSTLDRGIELPAPSDPRAIAVEDDDFVSVVIADPLRMPSKEYIFPAVFTYTANEEIAVSFPDLDIATSGTDDADALTSARESLGCTLYGLKQDGELIPKPSSILSIPLAENERVMLIDVYMPRA